MSVVVKICGLTNPEDALVAAQAGADYLGFIFYAKSPRYVTPDVAREIVARVRNHCQTMRTLAPGSVCSPVLTPRFTGVFVNLSLQQIVDIIAHVGLDLVQLHGDETPSMLEAIPGAAYKALRPKSTVDALASAARYAPFAAPSGPQVFVDAYTPDAYGGTGQRTDWAIATALVAAYPRLMLAGGLTPDNVADAVASVAPWGVDVSSGVEIAPGRKDHSAVRRFVAVAKATRK